MEVGQVANKIVNRKAISVSFNWQISVNDVFLRIDFFKLNPNTVYDMET